VGAIRGGRKLDLPVFNGRICNGYFNGNRVWNKYDHPATVATITSTGAWISKDPDLPRTIVGATQSITLSGTRDVAFSPDGRSIAVVGSFTGRATVYEYNFTSNQYVALSSRPTVTGTTTAATSVVWSADGRWLLITYEGHTSVGMAIFERIGDTFTRRHQSRNQNMQSSGINPSGTLFAASGTRLSTSTENFQDRRMIIVRRNTNGTFTEFYGNYVTTDKPEDNMYFASETDLIALHYPTPEANQNGTRISRNRIHADNTITRTDLTLGGIINVPNQHDAPFLMGIRNTRILSRASNFPYQMFLSVNARVYHVRLTENFVDGYEFTEIANNQALTDTQASLVMANNEDARMYIYNPRNGRYQGMEYNFTSNRWVESYRGTTNTGLNRLKMVDSIKQKS